MVGPGADVRGALSEGGEAAERSNAGMPEGRISSASGSLFHLPSHDMQLGYGAEAEERLRAALSSGSSGLCFRHHLGC